MNRILKLSYQKRETKRFPLTLLKMSSVLHLEQSRANVFLHFDSDYKTSFFLPTVVFYHSNSTKIFNAFNYHFGGNTNCYSLDKCHKKRKA